MDDVAIVILGVGILVFLAHLFSAIFSQTRIPDVLLLIIIGLLVGPGLGLVTAADFGAVGPVFTTITLVILLFEEGIGLSLRVLKRSVWGSSSLSLVNFLVSMTAVATITFYVTDVGPVIALMLGAIVGSTSPAVIIPLVRQLEMRDESRTILLLESAVSDVFSILVALALFEFFRMGEVRVGLMLGHMIASFALASILGAAGGLLWSILLNKIRTLKNAIFTTPAFIFVVFGIAEELGYSGYIAALAFGITLGNIKSFELTFLQWFIPHEPIALNQTEKVFVSEVSFLLKTFFFVYVGLSVELTDPWIVSVGFLLTVVMFLLRLPVVRLSLEKSIPVADAALMAAMVPKGLATVVLASIPLQKGIEGGELIQNVAYAVVLFSIIVTALLVFLIERTPVGRAYAWVFTGFSPGSTGPAPAREGSR